MTKEMTDKRQKEILEAVYLHVTFADALTALKALDLQQLAPLDEGEVANWLENNIAEYLDLSGYGQDNDAYKNLAHSLCTKFGKPKIDRGRLIEIIKKNASLCKECKGCGTTLAGWKEGKQVRMICSNCDGKGIIIDATAISAELEG